MGNILPITVLMRKLLILELKIISGSYANERAQVQAVWKGHPDNEL